LLLSLVVSSLAAPEAPEVHQSAGGGGVFDFVNSWFDKISSWFGSFGFGSGFSSTVNIDVVDINNKSASLNCSWSGPGSANLSWSVEGQSVGTGELLTITWDDLDKQAGEVVLVTCSGQSSGSSSSNQTGASSWASVSEVTKSLIVPGSEADSQSIDSQEIESEEEDDDDDDDDEEDEDEDDDESDEDGE